MKPKNLLYPTILLSTTNIYCNYYVRNIAYDHTRYIWKVMLIITKYRNAKLSLLKNYVFSYYDNLFNIIL